MGGPWLLRRLRFPVAAWLVVLMLLRLLLLRLAIPLLRGVMRLRLQQLVGNIHKSACSRKRCKRKTINLPTTLLVDTCKHMLRARYPCARSRHGAGMEQVCIKAGNERERIARANTEWYPTLLLPFFTRIIFCLGNRQMYNFWCCQGSTIACLLHTISEHRAMNRWCTRCVHQRLRW